MKRFFKQYLFYFLIAIFILVLAAGFVINRKTTLNKTSETQPTSDIAEPPSQTPAPTSTSTTSEVQNITEEIPTSYQIENVPFQPQAPFANWDQTHDEACEEASLVILEYFLKGKSLSAEQMDKEILAMVDWEVKNWGSHKDLTAQETAELGKNFYGFSDFEVKQINSLDDIKKEVSQNHPVIVPAAGRLLGNPYFRSPGPVYHMLVVTGYNLKEIITNDIGTRRGENFHYANSIFLNAIHDWAGSAENIESGQKVMIVIKN